MFQCREKNALGPEPSPGNGRHRNRSIQGLYSTKGYTVQVVIKYKGQGHTIQKVIQLGGIQYNGSYSTGGHTVHGAIQYKGLYNILYKDLYSTLVACNPETYQTYWYRSTQSINIIKLIKSIIHPDKIN